MPVSHGRNPQCIVALRLCNSVVYLTKTGMLAANSMSLRSAAIVLAVSALTACSGGGSDDSITNQGPTTLAAALPDGDHIGFAAATMQLSEENRRGSLRIVRTGSGQGMVSVRYRFNDVTATLGQDYLAREGVLNWQDGDLDQKDIAFVVLSDLQGELTEQFTVELFDLNGGETLSSNSTVTVALQDSVCSSNTSLLINADVDWSKACYHLDSSVQVEANARLTKSAGTTIIADASVGVTIADQASIASVGTADNPVRWVGAEPLGGYWQGLLVTSTNSLQNISHSLFSDARVGVDMLAGSGGFASFSNNGFSNTQSAAISLPLKHVDQIDDSNDFIDEPGGGVAVVHARIVAGEPITVPKLSTHFISTQSMIADGPLTLEAGVDLRFGASAQLYVSNQGSLTALGSQDKPIKITGLNQVPGYWNGIQWASSSSVNNSLAYVKVSYGGGDPVRAGNIIVGGTGTVLELDHCTLAFSEGVGYLQTSEVADVVLTETVFVDNALGAQSVP